MRVLLDSSVLVAVLLANHSSHQHAIRWLAKSAKTPDFGHVCQHGPAETYAVLSGLPGPMRVPPREVAKLLHHLTTFIEIVQLDQADYVGANSRLSAAGMDGAVIYDMLHAMAAERCGADRIVTGNAKDFQRLPWVGAVEVVGIDSVP